MKLKLKVCGMREPENIFQVVEEIKPDYMGFIFYEKSPRNAVQLDPTVIQNVPTQKTGVFVNASLEYILDIANQYQLDLLQLHGEESPELCHQLKERGFQISKAIGVKDKLDIELLKRYQNYVDYFLFDTKGENRGGNGIVFDWSVLQSYSLDIPFFLAGGIDENNIQELESLKGLPLYAIDVNSKFEVSPGLKDLEKLNLLRERLRQLTF